MDITRLIINFSGLAIFLITIYLYPMIRAQISEKHWKMLQDIVAVAVYAAEQLGATKAIEDKLEYALEAVGSQLQKYKITFDRETIRAAIEAAVKENFPGTQKSKKIGIMP